MTHRGGLSLRIIIWRIGEGGQASFTLGPKNYLGGPGYHLCVPLVVVTIHPLFPLLWPITGILIIVAQRMPLAEQELLTFLDLPISSPFLWGSFCSVFSFSVKCFVDPLFSLFLLVIVLLDLRFLHLHPFLEEYFLLWLVVGQCTLNNLSIKYLTRNRDFLFRV